ncbi:MAG: 50S ribosomal protein L22 [Patescibacteria group bacterium]
MEVRAHLRYLHISPRKVRLVVNLVRGLPIDQAVDQLTVLPKRASRPVLKLLNSAVANAEHNFKLERKSLRIKSIVANEGPRLKRYRPRAFGRAAEILKRMTHVTVVLEDLAKTAPLKAAPTKPAAVTATKGPVKQAPVKAPIVPGQAAFKPPSKSPTAKPQARGAEDPSIRRQGTS